MVDFTKRFSLIEFKDLLKDTDFKFEDYDFEDEIFSFTDDEKFQFDNSEWELKEINTLWDTTYNNQSRTIVSQFGWVILRENEIKYVVTIYEPHGCMINSKRGVITFDGHEEVKTLYLDNGEIDSRHTR